MQEATQFKGTTITRQQALQGMEEYDLDYPKNDYCEPPALKPWHENRLYKWALVHRGRQYPPKYLASQLTGRAPKHEGLGAGNAIRIFEELGFEVQRLRP